MTALAEGFDSQRVIRHILRVIGEQQIGGWEKLREGAGGPDYWLSHSLTIGQWIAWKGHSGPTAQVRVAKL